MSERMETGDPVAADDLGGASDLETLLNLADSAGSLADRMGIILLEASADRVVATMPVEGNTQPFGLLHGGASAVLAETVGSIAATLHAQRLHGGYALGVELSATHHRSARSGLVTGVATPLHLGGSVASYEIVIKDDNGDRVCTARLTCLLRRVPRG
jgi:1,4-dihydroxy-2-naphthoyl-CoA hydrolase